MSDIPQTAEISKEGVVSPTVSFTGETQTNNSQNISVKELSIDGLPEGYKVSDGSEKDQKYLTGQFRDVIEGNKWLLKAANYNGEFWMSMQPKQTDGVVDLGDGKYLDTRIGLIDSNGQITTNPESGYSLYQTGNIQPSEGLIFRGLSKGEMDQILSSNRISSRGDVINDIGKDMGLTFFSKDPEKSLGYAISQRLPGYKSPSFEEPNYMIAVRDPGNYKINEDNEIGIEGEIAADQITKIYEVRPVSIKSGEIPLAVSPNRQVSPLGGLRMYSNAPKIEIAIKDVTNNLASKIKDN